MNTTIYQRIARLTAVIVLLVAMLAFVVSFEAIREYAADHGVSAQLAWIIPLLVDTFIVVASLVIWLRSLDGERALMAMVMLATATGVSLILNVAHAGRGDLMSQAVAAIPPAALIASFHVAMSELRRSVQRRQEQEQEQAKLDAEAAAEQAKSNAFRAWFDGLAPAERARVIWETTEVQGGRRLTGAELEERLDSALTKRRCEQLLKQWRTEQAAAAVERDASVEAEIIPPAFTDRALVTAGDR